LEVFPEAEALPEEVFPEEVFSEVEVFLRLGSSPPVWVLSFPVLPGPKASGRMR
jgi:hypothetical protein